MDAIEEFFDYQTVKFWIAIIIIIGIHFIPIPGEEDIVLILFTELFKETKSIFFLIGAIAIEFVIIIVPFVGVQRILTEKMGFN